MGPSFRLVSVVRTRGGERNCACRPQPAILLMTIFYICREPAVIFPRPGPGESVKNLSKRKMRVREVLFQTTGRVGAATITRKPDLQTPAFFFEFPETPTLPVKRCTTDLKVALIYRVLGAIVGPVLVTEPGFELRPGLSSQILNRLCAFFFPHQSTLAPSLASRSANTASAALTP